MKRIIRPIVVAALALLAPAWASGQDHADHAGHGQPHDSTAVASVVGDFHAALARGDSARVLELLAPGARILEGGGIETVEEYRAHHLPADIAFATAVERERGPLEVTIHGDVAWVASTNRATGTWRDREIDSRGAELVVLSRPDGAWRIEAVHWSSR